MTAEKTGGTRATLLRVGIFVGAALVVVPFLTALVGIGRASAHVEEGLRGATRIADRQEQVGVALRFSSLTAILAPMGILLGVSCGLALAGDRRRPPPP